MFEWLKRKWSFLRWFFRTFWNKSKFQNFEVDSTIRLKKKKKGLIVSGNTINADRGGHIIIEN